MKLVTLMKLRWRLIWSEVAMKAFGSRISLAS